MRPASPSEPDHGTLQRLSVSIRGRVQGVGFRYFTRLAAQRLGLTGFVRNERDGSVTVVAEGPRDRLDELADALREGPPHAEVDEVDVRWERPRGTFAAFTIER